MDLLFIYFHEEIISEWFEIIFFNCVHACIKNYSHYIKLSTKPKKMEESFQK